MRPTDPRLPRQLRAARNQLVGVVAAAGVNGVLVLAQAWVVTGLIVVVVTGGALETWAIATAGVLILRGLVTMAGESFAASAAARVGTDLRARLMRATVGRSESAAGEISVLATRGVSAAEPYLTRYLPAVALAVVLPPITVIAIATQDLLSAVIVVATLPLVPVFGALVGLATRDRAAAQWRTMAALAGHFLDVVRGLPTLVAHRRAGVQSARIGQITDRYRRQSWSTLRVAFASSAVLELVATLSVALVAVTVGVRLAAGGLDLRTALVVLLLAPEAYWPLRRMGAEFHAAAEGAATFAAVHDVLESAAAPPGHREGDPATPRGAGLVLDGVAVTYPGRTRPALAELSTTIAAHGVTVVTGPSGGGKSTLLLTLARLLPTDAGTITSAGTCAALDVRGTPWQERIAWLPQRPLFVAGSIADNLRLGTPGADDETLWTALRSVALEERVRSLPGGLAAPLGEDGATLSAGERARLALARILVADRPWNLLDEPTAHLDPVTERVILDAIVELGRRGAVVVVSHRPSVIALADAVLTLQPAPGSTGPTNLTHRAVEPVAPIPPIAETATMPAPARVGLRLLGGLGLGSLASLSGVALTATAGWLIVQASARPAMLTLMVAIVGVRAFGLARPVLRYAERLVTHDAALRLLARRRVAVYDSLIPLTPARLGKRRGDVLTSIVDDVDSTVDRELRVRLPVRTFVVVASVSALVAAAILPGAALVVAGTALVAGAGGLALALAGSARAEKVHVAARAEVSSAVVATVHVGQELRIWQATDRAVARISDASDRLGRASAVSSRWLGAGRALQLATVGLALPAMAALTAPEVAQGDISGALAALLVLIPLALVDAAAPVVDAGALSVRTRAAAARLAQLEDTEPAVLEQVDRPRVALPTSYDVQVRDVRAQWNADSATIAPASLSLAPGDRVGLVGASGTGKSTVAALLLRFLDPVSGRVDLGGHDTRSLALDDVREVTGLVNDDPHVFATTLVENVRLARPRATDAQVEDAIRRARLGDWLDSLPEGLDTWLGDGHSEVSGGERARLGIARCLLAEQPVLVLDEPAAHLDHPTAAALANEVLTGPRRRTVLWITHSDAGLDLVDRTVDLSHPHRPTTEMKVP